jgi:hypothetical protein
MKRLNVTKKGGLVLAGALLIWGLCLSIHPIELQANHPGMSFRNLGPDAPPQHLSKHKARVVGLVSIAFGLGLIWLVFYPERK